MTAPELAKAREPIAALRKALPGLATSLVMQERRPEHARTTHVHRRGEYLKPAEPVEPGVPAVLHPLPSGAPRDRLALANWLVAPENPLVGRVRMNQLWQAYFGRGLVATTEDFGTQGARPTHPELLDWLATEFPRRGYSTKAMHRLIVTSATYRQSSRATADQLARDPRNDHLGRGPRFRVTAEVVRDIALETSGLLSHRLGGPSVYPPQPEGATALAYSQSPWPVSTGADRYRRGLYTYLKRTAPYAASITMDAPTSETTCVRRERSNTPLQALDPAQRRGVRRGRAGPGASGHPRVPGRIDRGPRPPRLPPRSVPAAEPRRAGAVVRFHQRQLGRFRSGELDAAQVAGLDAKAPLTPLLSPSLPPATEAAELAAWTTVARVLLNLDETMTKE